MNVTTEGCRGSTTLGYLSEFTNSTRRITAHHRHFSDRSINLEVDLEAGVYEVRLKITSKKGPDRPKIEDVIRFNWSESRDKLTEICRSYDLAHAKIAVPQPRGNGVEAKKTPKNPNSNMKADGPNAAAKPDSKAEEQKSEDKSAKAVTEPDKKPDESVQSEAKEAKPESKLHDRAEEAKADSKSDVNSKVADSESNQSSEEQQPESTVEATDQEHTSVTDTTSTEPELIEKPDVTPECESTEKDAVKQSDVVIKGSKPEDATVQSSLHNQPADSESSASKPLAASSPGDNNQPPTRGAFAVAGAGSSIDSICPPRDIKTAETIDNNTKEPEDQKRDDKPKPDPNPNPNPSPQPDEKDKTNQDIPAPAPNPPAPSPAPRPASAPSPNPQRPNPNPNPNPNPENDPNKLTNHSPQSAPSDYGSTARKLGLGLRLFVLHRLHRSRRVGLLMLRARLGNEVKRGTSLIG